VTSFPAGATTKFSAAALGVSARSACRDPEVPGGRAHHPLFLPYGILGDSRRRGLDFAGEEPLPIRPKDALAHLLLPTYSARLDKANYLALVREWIRANRPGMATVDNRQLLYAFLGDEIIQGAAIDYLEFGVYQVSSLREWIRINSNANSRFFGFDSFRGLPEDWVPGFAKGAYDLSGAPPLRGHPRNPR